MLKLITFIQALGVSSTCSKALDDVKELLIETLSQRTVLDLTNGAAAAMEILPTGNFYTISTLKFHWSEVSEKQSSMLHHLSSEQINSIKIDNICKVSEIHLPWPDSNYLLI